MYDNIKRLCNTGITFANNQIKYNKDKKYYMGVKNAYNLVLQQIMRNEIYIKRKGGEKSEFYKKSAFLFRL